MSELSRRTFLARTGAGVVTAGLVAAVPTIAGAEKLAKSDRSAARSNEAATTDTQGTRGPLVVHVPDPRTGEVHFMIGTKEVVHKDRALVARLLRDAR
jgi:hypothetical protein